VVNRSVVCSNVIYEWSDHLLILCYKLTAESAWKEFLKSANIWRSYRYESWLSQTPCAPGTTLRRSNAWQAVP